MMKRMTFVAHDVKGKILRNGLLIPLVTLTLSGCAVKARTTYVDQAPGMTDQQLSQCISNTTITNDTQRADCQYEQDRRNSLKLASAPPKYRMNPVLNDGEWHSFYDVDYKKAEGLDEYPHLYIRQHLKSGAYDLVKEKFDCVANKSSLEAGTQYSKSGEVKNSFNSTYDDWRDVLPDTYGAAALFQACLKII